MLPDYLSTSYQRYKIDTDFIATWLATTARNCGFVLNDNGLELDIEKPKKLKGRARTLARRAAEAGAGTSSNQKGEKITYMIAVKDFLPMAKHIASYKKSSVKIPKKFIDVLDRAISLRKMVSQAVVDHQGSSEFRSAVELKADSQHSHFVCILEDVRSTLGHLFPSIAKQANRSQNVGPDSAPEIDLVNMFEGLHVEEPFGNEEAPRPANVKEAADASTVSYKSEQATDLMEAIFAFSCLLQDLRQMRDAVTECWQKYKDLGECSLIAAALTSNIAIELARRLEEDMDGFAKFGGSEALIEAFHATHCWALSQQPSYQHLKPSDFDSAAYDSTSKAVFWSAYKELKFYLKWLQEEIPKHEKDKGPDGQEYNRVSIFYRPGMYGTYNPLADRAKMTGRAKQQEDRILLGELVSDMSLWALVKLKLPYDDEFKRGFTDVYETGRIPLWLVFAAQLFLDVNHILRDKVSNGFEDLCRMCMAINASIHDQYQYQQEVLGEDPPPDEGAACVQLAKSVDSICNYGALEALRQKLPQYHGVQIEKHRMPKIHPLMCGLKAYANTMAFHEISLRWVNTKTSILACAHLHNALYSERLLHSPWKDMVFFMLIQDRTHLFAGDHPQDAQQYHRRFCLAVMGHSATNFARNRRRPDHIAHATTGHRKIEGQSPVSKLFLERYCVEPERSNLAAQDVIAVLGKHRWFFADMPDRSGVGCRAVILGPRAGQHLDGKQNSKRDEKLTMPQLLRNVLSSLSAEAFELSFDYLRLHRNSTRLLRAIKDATSNRMQDLKISDKERDLRMAVEYMLATLAAERQDAASLGLPPIPGGYGPVGRAMLRAVAQRMHDIMNERSDQLTSNGKGHTRGVENMKMLQAIHHVQLKIDVEEAWFNGELEA